MSLRCFLPGDEALESMDFEPCTISSTSATLVGKLLDDSLVKLVAWYDDEWDFSILFCDLVKHVANVGERFGHEECRLVRQQVGLLLPCCGPDQCIAKVDGA